jgi:poly-gamma-glutamate synthesis protein (capsule biosynthesis protein)
MIFTGDVASPDLNYSQKLSEVFLKHHDIFQGRVLVCNFEGLVSNEISPDHKEPILFNHATITEVLAQRGPVVNGLANNHILDLPEHFDQTLETFGKRNILYSGAGKSPVDAIRPAFFIDEGKEIFLYNLCWDFLLYNQNNPSGGIYIAEIEEQKLLRAVSLTKIEHPESKVAVYLHWNFDLETLPFPMHRQYARALIDNGADLVVGAHSHCVQGGEMYKDGYIVYGLGNFYIPHHVFANGKIAYPIWSATELLLEWNPATNKATCHWFEYIENNTIPLLYLGSDDFACCSRLKSFSPYREMNEKEYIRYFRKNRRKKLLIPVFADYRAQRVNRIKTAFLIGRARFARWLAKNNLIKWQN